VKYVLRYFYSETEIAAEFDWGSNKTNVLAVYGKEAAQVSLSVK
jgi:hypothetical protein